MFPTLQIGSISLQVPGLIYLVGLWIGLTLSERRIKILGNDPGYLYNLVFVALISGVIGARLSYIVTYPDAFSTNPWNIVSINPGLLDPNAGILVGIGAGFIYVYRKKLPGWVVLDDLTPLLALLAVAQGIANFSSGSGFGSPTQLPWSIFIWGTNRHPTQIYETLFATVVLAVLLMLGRLKTTSIPGNLFLSFITMTSSYRLFLEAFRGDSLLIGEGWRLTQVISWIILATSLALLIKNFRTSLEPDSE